MDFEKIIVNLLKKHTKLKEISLETPPNSDLGDYAFPCFQLSKKLKKSPFEMAQDLAEKISPPKSIEKVISIGPYLNFFINKEEFIQETLKEIHKKKNKYGSSNIGKKQRIMVEYSSPNTNKPLTLGHLRNDSLGMAISNILTFTNHKVIKSILLSNRGAHICKSMYMYKKYGKNKKPNIKLDHFVGKFYVMFQQKVAKHKKLEKTILEMLQKWEKGDKETRQLWKKLDSWAIQGFKETYKMFGSKFDVTFKESDFYNKAQPIIEQGLKKHIFKKDEDSSIFIDLEKYNLSKKIIQRANETAIYVTNDLALTKHKFEHYNLDRSIWIVGSEQDLYFQQLFKIFELLNYSWAKDCFHLSYNLVYLPEGKMKSREGNVIDADDIIEEMTSLAKQGIIKRHKLKKEELEKRSKAIGLSALKYYLLKYDTSKNIHFNPKESLSIEGDTGPYIQYSLARANSILKKAKSSNKIDYSLYNQDEFNLIRQLSLFPTTIEKTSTSLRPHLLTTYLFELAQTFNEYYHTHQVLKAQKKTKEARLVLTSAVIQVLTTGLKLLGITPLKSM